MIILLNGAAGSGKGTLSRILARYLKMPHYDFGLLFRATSFARQDDLSWVKIAKLIAGGNLYVDHSRLLWDGTDITEHLLSEDVGLVTAQLARSSPEQLVELSKSAVRHADFIADGRTVSEIYPHADWHFQIVADYKAAERRRIKQGGDPTLFKRRWKLDEGRVAQSSRAVVIDTTDHTPKHCVRMILNVIHEAGQTPSLSRT